MTIPPLLRWGGGAWAVRPRLLPFGGGGPPPTSPLDPLSIIAGVTTLAYWNTELDVVQSGGLISALGDQVGSADFTQATGSLQPIYTAADGTLNNKPTITADGVDDFMAGTLNLPAPGTTPSWFWGIAKQVSWAAPDGLFNGGASAAIKLGGRTSSPNVNIFNGTHGNVVAMTPGTWFRFEALFNNNTTDYLKVGSNSQTGVNVGNSDPGLLTLFALSTGVNPSNFAFYCMAVANGDPGATVKTNLDNWAALHLAGAVSL